MKFSERIGITKPKTELVKEGLSSEIKNSLWTLTLELIIDKKSNIANGYGENLSDLTKYFRDIWINFFKRPIDNLPKNMVGQVDQYSATSTLREWYYKAEWYLILDFIEFIAPYNLKFTESCNFYLSREFSSYRFIENKLVEVNSKEEIIEIENAIANSDKFKSVRTHLKTGLDLLSDRKKPDYRNSIKESISAVESLCKIITNDNKTTLGQALKKIEHKHKIPKSLQSAFSTLYGYTSDEGGIRHSLLENESEVDVAEARFMLITCSAFVNYLLNKI